MNARGIAQKVFMKIEDQDWDGALALLTDDFTFSGAVPQPINGRQWIGVHRALAGAMPDLRFNFAGAGDDNGTARGTVALTGTHTGEFVAPIPGLPNVPPTGKRIALPKEPITVTERDGKLANLHVEPVPNGGLLGILKQMGVTVPVAS